MLSSPLWAYRKVLGAMDQSPIKDERERPWLYLVVKVLVLLIVLFSLVGANVVGEVKISESDLGFVDYYSYPSTLSHNPTVNKPLFSVFFGWPFSYAWRWGLYEAKFTFPASGGVLVEPRRCIFDKLPSIMNRGCLCLNIAIAIVILLYLSHVINVFHRRSKPTYRQYSLRFLLALPVMLAVVMMMFHYDVVTWRRPFLVPVYLAVLVSAVCFVYEVRSFVRRKKSDA